MNSQPPTSEAVAPRRRFSLRRQSPAQEQPWQLTCLCGQTLAGTRQATAQAVRCEHCDRRHFVLPANPYPAPRKERRGQGKAIAFQLGREIRLIVTRASQLAGRGVKFSVAWLRNRVIALAVACWQWLTPLRAALTGLAAIVLLSSLIGWQNYRLGVARQTLREALQQGQTAVAAADWPTATEAFARAAQSVVALRRRDELALGVQQWDRELQAMQRLAALSLEEMVNEASGTRRLAGTWESTYRQLIHHRWLVVECWLETVGPPPETEGAPAAAAPSRTSLQLTQTIPVGDEQVTFLWPDRLLASPTDPTSAAAGPVHVVCAGQIQEFRRPAQPGQPWVVVMRDDSAFLWWNPETCVALGIALEPAWMPVDSVKLVLERQRQQILGGSSR